MATGRARATAFAGEHLHQQTAVGSEGPEIEPRIKAEGLERSRRKIDHRGGPDPALDGTFVLKPETPIKRPPHLRGTQFGPCHTAFLNEFQGPLHEPARQAAAAVGGIGDDHSYPSQRPAIANHRCRGHDRSIALETEAALGLEEDQSGPIALRLIPANALG